MRDFSPVMDAVLGSDPDAFGAHVLDQHILEEDYDENYEPTEEGTELGVVAMVTSCCWERGQ